MKEEEILVQIERLSSDGGRGVARYAGLVVFIPKTIPGETCRVRIHTRKKNYAEAELIEVVSASAARRSPPCSIWDHCGGCPLMHINYSQQLLYKQEMILGVLTRLGGIAVEKVFPIEKSAHELGYRNRIQLQAKDTKLGYHGRDSHELVEVQECLIAEPEINQYLRENRSKLAQETGRFEILHNESEVRARRTQLGDPTEFIQVNREVNDKILDLISRLAQTSPYMQVYDLYSGAGNIAIHLARARAQLGLNFRIIGIESSSVSVSRARDLIAQYALSDLEFRCEDVASFLNKGALSKMTEGPILFILDPPRSGCDSSVLEKLTSIPNSSLIYVSCNPSTFARDVKLLSAKGAEVVSIQPFDMFPQTDHVELVSFIKLC